MKTWNSPLGDHLYVGAGNDTYRLPGRGGFDAIADALGNDSDGGGFVKASDEAGTQYLLLNGQYVNVAK